MPFDTTYNLLNDTGSDESIVITKSGGKDTTIYVNNEELPALLIRHPEISELLYKNQETIKPEPKSHNGINFFEITLLIAVIILLNGIIRNLPAIGKALKKSNAPKILILLFFIFLGIAALVSGSPEFGCMLLIFTTGVMFEFKNEIFYSGSVKNNSDESAYLQTSLTTVKTPLLKYNGAALKFTDAEIDSALHKRFPFYTCISLTEKERFIHRVKNFIADKVFYIHDKSGFKEMPILISASAIQLTFGLKKYLLPYFKNIHIYPEEFFRSNNMGVCFLEGNVSANNINLSWKHFLQGYEKGNDGQNVGLHELAHALYYQAFVVGQNVDEDFRNTYDNFINYGNKVYDTEKTVAGGLYSDYAVTDFQEFWAESAEIFFEKPAELKEMYPHLYETIKTLLNQDLANQAGLPVS